MTSSIYIYEPASYYNIVFEQSVNRKIDFRYVMLNQAPGNTPDLPSSMTVPQMAGEG